MPSLNGIEAARQIKSELNRVKIIFLTMHPDVSYASMAFDVGASGYVLKNSASRELVTAIDEAMKGGTYVTPLIAGELMQNLKQGQSDDNAFNVKLTIRQREVYRNFIKKSYNLPEKIDTTETLRKVHRIIHEAHYHTFNPTYGPVHFECSTS